MSKTYKQEEVAVHKTPASLWIVVDGDVYDVTKVPPSPLPFLPFACWGRPRTDGEESESSSQTSIRAERRFYSGSAAKTPPRSFGSTTTSCVLPCCWFAGLPVCLGLSCEGELTS